MFMGVRSHHGTGRVTDYASAAASHDRQSRTPTGRARKPIELYCAGGGTAFPLGLTRRGETKVIRYGANESIAFRLYETDVVTYHADGSFSIENFGTVTTTAFASQFLPRGFHLYHPVTKRGNEGGHRGIGYQSADRSWRLCWGSAVTFRPDGDGFTPDADTLDPIMFPELDRAKSRPLAKRFHLADFEMWLSMAPRHMDIEHKSSNIDACLDALETRDFRRAAQYLPVIQATGAYGYDPRDHALPIATRYHDGCITMGSLDKLRLGMWEHEDCFDTLTFDTIDRGEFDRRMARAKQLNALTHSSWGPSS